MIFKTYILYPCKRNTLAHCWFDANWDVGLLENVASGEVNITPRWSCLMPVEMMRK